MTNKNLDLARQLLQASRVLAAGKSMTYGVLPDEASFRLACEEKLPDGVYRMRNMHDKHVSQDEDLSCDELWDLCVHLVELFNEGDDDAGSLCSDIMTTLGFEWI